MAACTVAPLSCGALACLTLSMHQSPQDGAGGGCTSSSDAVAEASTLLHHGKHKRGMWRHMRSLHDLGMAHLPHCSSPHQCMATSQCDPRAEPIPPRRSEVSQCRIPLGWSGSGGLLQSVCGDPYRYQKFEHAEIMRVCVCSSS